MARQGECARPGCGHDIKDGHFQGKYACSMYRCDCKSPVVEDANGKLVVAEPDDDAWCSCKHLTVDHSAVGCHWCNCKRERR